MTTVVVMAKECVPGRVKTRLCPPFTDVQAAAIAEASLADTLGAVDAMDATRRILCLEGALRVDPVGWEVVPQVDGGLDARIASALDGCRGPTLLIGMDTPQISGAMLDDLCRSWASGDDALLGPAADGGFWLLAMREPVGDLVRGIPMSRPDTGFRQRARLVGAGLRVQDVGVLTDIDTAESLWEVAPLLAEGRLASLLRALGGARDAGSPPPAPSSDRKVPASR